MKTIQAKIFIKSLSIITADIVEIKDITKNAKLKAINIANLPLIVKIALIPQISSSIQQIYNYLSIPIGLYRVVCSLKTQMEVNQ